MEHLFGRAAPFALGVEEGPLLVDAGTKALAHVSSRLVPVRDATLRHDGALEEVERILRDGNGAARMRAAHAEGGMARVPDQLVDESAEPLEAR